MTPLDIPVPVIVTIGVAAIIAGGVFIAWVFLTAERSIKEVEEEKRDIY